MGQSPPTGDGKLSMYCPSSFRDYHLWTSELAQQKNSFTHWNLSCLYRYYGDSRPGIQFGLSFISMFERAKVKGLYLNNNELSPEDLKMWLHAFAKHPTLEELYIQCNKLGDEGVNALCGSLEQNKTLKILVLYENDFKDHKGICGLLAKNRSLTSLSLRWSHNLSEECAKALSAVLGVNNSLRSLELFDTQRYPVSGDRYSAPEPYQSIIHLRIKRNIGLMAPIFMAFLIGSSPQLHKKPNVSAIYTAYRKSNIFDRNTLYLIFDFLS